MGLFGDSEDEREGSTKSGSEKGEEEDDDELGKLSESTQNAVKDSRDIWPDFI